MKELPKYKRIKVVQGLKILAVDINTAKSVMITPSEEGYLPFIADQSFHERFKGTKDDLGYFVLYEGGYQSWSPSKEFENSHILLQDETAGVEEAIRQLTMRISTSESNALEVLQLTQAVLNLKELITYE